MDNLNARITIDREAGVATIESEDEAMLAMLRTAFPIAGCVKRENVRIPIVKRADASQAQ